jgi:hypothetical protein
MNGNKTFSTGSFKAADPVAPPVGAPAPSVNPIDALQEQANGTPVVSTLTGNATNVMQGVSETDKSAIARLLEAQFENRKKYTNETKILNVYAMKIDPRERIDGDVNAEYPVRDIKAAISNFESKFGITKEKFENPATIVEVPAAASCTMEELQGFIKLLKDLEAGTVKGCKVNLISKEDFDKKDKSIKGVKLQHGAKDEVVKMKDLEKTIVEKAAGLLNTTVPTIQFQVFQSKNIDKIFNLKGVTDAESRKSLKKKKSTTMRISNKKSLLESNTLIAEFVSVDKTKSTKTNPDEKITTYNFRSVDAIKYIKIVDGKEREFTFRLSLDVPQFALKYSVTELKPMGLGNTAEVPTIDLNSPESLNAIKANLLEIYAAESVKGTNAEINSMINSQKEEIAKEERDAAAQVVGGVDPV